MVQVALNQEVQYMGLQGSILVVDEEVILRERKTRAGKTPMVG